MNLRDWLGIDPGAFVAPRGGLKYPGPLPAGVMHLDTGELKANLAATVDGEPPMRYWNVRSPSGPTIHVELVGGGAYVTYEPAGRPPGGSPWALERCCDDRGLCPAPSWPAAYWHAVYRARRTRTRQGVRHLNGGWLTFGLGEPTPQTGTDQA